MKTHQPCPCGQSQDAYTIFPDGNGKCHSAKCGGKVFINNKETQLEPDKIKNLQIIEHRGLDKAVLNRYNIKVVVEDNEPRLVQFPYKKGQLTKNRVWGQKKFFYQGKVAPGVFGLEAFDKAELAREIIITEGEYDAPSAFQMAGIPAVSVQSATTALEDCKADFETLNLAQRIYICFDSDDPGKKAASLVASLFDFNKVYKIDLSTEYKDANGYLEAQQQELFRKAYRASKKFVPDGVISSMAEFREALEAKKAKPECAFPFALGEQKLEGMRLGASYLVSGLEGIGKTEVLRAIQYQVLKETDHNVGIIHLEEQKEDTLNCLLSYHVGAPLRRHKFDINIEDKMEALNDMVKRDNRVHIYSHFGSNDPDYILGIIRFLVAVCGCKFVFLDHINIIVSGLDSEKDERRILDYLSTRFAMLVEELNFCLVYVCHENDDGRPRGSRNMGQTAKVRLRLFRNLEAEEEVERNKLYINIAKNRLTGATGPIGYVEYDTERGHLVDPFQGHEEVPI
jgi:twinkle protein